MLRRLTCCPWGQLTSFLVSSIHTTFTNEGSKTRKLKLMVKNLTVSRRAETSPKA